MSVKRKLSGKLIKEKRLKLGYGVIDFACRCGISAGYIRDIENGTIKFPKKNNNIIAKQLHTTIEELMEEVVVEDYPTGFMNCPNYNDGSYSLKYIDKPSKVYQADKRGQDLRWC